MNKTSIAIIDYGMGNLHSVHSALTHVSPGDDVVITADPALIQRADRVVFPGVGAIKDCVTAMRRRGLHRLIPILIADGKPLLGICVGMQFAIAA